MSGGRGEVLQIAAALVLLHLSPAVTGAPVLTYRTDCISSPAMDQGTGL